MKLRMKRSCGLSQYLYGEAKFTPMIRQRPASVCDVSDEVGEKLLKTGWFETVAEAAESVHEQPQPEPAKKPFVKPTTVVEENPDDLTLEEQAAIDAEAREGGFDDGEGIDEEEPEGGNKAIEVKRMHASVAKLGTLTQGKLKNLKREVLVEVAQVYGVPVTESSTKGGLITAILAKLV